MISSKEQEGESNQSSEDKENTGDDPCWYGGKSW